MTISRIIPALLALGFAGSALAQAPASPPVIGYDIAPWWMAQPVLPSMGHVEAEVRANRAQVSASFMAVAKSAPEATRQAADKVRALAQALAAHGPERVRVQVTFSQRAIYEQYRDKDGNLISNQRSDKIDSYEATATVQLEVRDTSLLEQVYNSVIGARPTNTQPIYFHLEPSNETRTELHGKAVADARRRAEQSVAALNGSLGGVKLVDPSGRACETDVLLAGADRDHFLPPPEQVTLASTSQAVAGVVQFAPPPPPPAPLRPGAAGAAAEDLKLPVQPPMETLQASACVIYALKT